MSQDSEVDNYLQGKSDLSRLYADAPQIEPPDHLDAAILAEAHRAVNARPGAKPKRRWAVPLGLVASLFAVVMIGLQLPYLLREPTLQQAPVAQMDENVAAPALRAPDEGRRVRAVDKAKSEMTSSKPAEAYAQPAAPIVVAPAAKRLEMRESAEIQSAGALAKEKESAAVGGGKLNDTLELRAPAAALMASPPPAQLERALKKDETDEAALRPEDWLTRIRKLRQEGKQEEVKKELAAFKKRYPDYPVPTALELK
jgi:hypothetical protein